MMNHPEKAEIYNRVPVNDSIGIGVTEDSDGLKDIDESREALPTTGSHGGLVGEVVAGTANSAPSSSSPTRGPGVKAGTKEPRGEHDPFTDLSDQLPMATTDSNKKALEVWIKEYTGQQVQRQENTAKPASEMCGKSAFFGWCHNYQGTNADIDVSTMESLVNSNLMGYVRSHQLDGHHHHLGADRGHLLHDGYRVEQQVDHALHQGDPLRDTGGQQELPGGQAHQAEPHGRAHVQGEVPGGGVRNDGQLRDTGGCEEPPHDKVDGSRRFTLRNRRFVKKLDPKLRRMPNPATVQPKSVKKAPVKKKIPKSGSTVPEVQQEPPVTEVPEVPLGAADEQDHHNEVYEWIDEQIDQAGLVDEASTDVNVPAAHPLPAQTETELAVPVIDQPRPRRSSKPNPKCSPGVYDRAIWGLSQGSGVGGALEEQECDEQVPGLFGGGGGLAKSETAVNVVLLSTPDLREVTSALVNYQTFISL